MLTVIWWLTPDAVTSGGQDLLAMQKNPPANDPQDREDRVVPLRKTAANRGRSTGHGTGPQGQPPIGDLDQYPQTDEADDYRHRMMTNVVGIAIAVVLITIGIWIADTMASMRKNQDCVLSGRRGCTPVDAPLPQRW
jgi:hypothetical protein